MRNASVFPDPVPVVTSVGCGSRSRLDSRRHACTWCRYGTGSVRRPLQDVPPALAGAPERRPDPQVRPAEDPVRRMVQELLKRLPHRRVRQRERRGQVLREVRLQFFRGQRRSHRMSPSPSRLPQPLTEHRMRLPVLGHPVGLVEGRGVAVRGRVLRRILVVGQELVVAGLLLDLAVGRGDTPRASIRSRRTT